MTWPRKRSSESDVWCHKLTLQGERYVRLVFCRFIILRVAFISVPDYSIFQLRLAQLKQIHKQTHRVYLTTLCQNSHLHNYTPT